MSMIACLLFATPDQYSRSSAIFTFLQSIGPEVGNIGYDQVVILACHVYHHKSASWLGSFEAEQERRISNVRYLGRVRTNDRHLRDHSSDVVLGL
jgi:hypothetical protein